MKMNHEINEEDSISYASETFEGYRRWDKAEEGGCFLKFEANKLYSLTIHEAGMVQKKKFGKKAFEDRLFLYSWVICDQPIFTEKNGTLVLNVPKSESITQDMIDAKMIRPVFWHSAFKKGFGRTLYDMIKTPSISEEVDGVEVDTLIEEPVQALRISFKTTEETFKKDGKTLSFVGKTMRRMKPLVGPELPALMVLSELFLDDEGNLRAN